MTNFLLGIIYIWNLVFTIWAVQQFAESRRRRKEEAAKNTQYYLEMKALKTEFRKHYPDIDKAVEELLGDPEFKRIFE